MVLVGLTAASCNSKSSLRQEKFFQIKQYTISVQLADSPEERASGMAGISGISDTEGMLFLFSEPTRPQFWMKGVVIPLDIIWINGDKIVHIEDNVKPEINVADTQLKRYVAPVEADKILEVNGGWAYRHDVNVGDTIQEVPSVNSRP